MNQVGIYLVPNILIDLTAMAVVIIILFNARKDKNNDYSQTIFCKMLIWMIIYLISDLIAWIIDGRVFDGSHIIKMIFNSLIYMTQTIFAFYWLLYTDYWIFHSQERIKKRRLIYIIPVIAELLLLILNMHKGMLFWIDENNMYSRGDMYILGLLVFYCYDLYTLVLILWSFTKAKDREQKKYYLCLTAFIMPPVLAGLILVLFVFGISVTPPFYALSLLIIYMNVHQRSLLMEREKLARSEAELRDANMSIMLSQIQPHFLYNSLSSIKCLCKLNPILAEKAIVDFSFFLRGNMNSLTMNTTISFEQELEHTKHYLSLELLRFSDRLKVQYDIKTTAFRLPTLTIQPIAENAVRHGITSCEKGGTVTIATYETIKEYVVMVEDDGIGFNLEKAQTDEKKHIGIRNVSERLMNMCNGTLDITSKLGVGTKVEIHIPKYK